MGRPAFPSSAAVTSPSTKRVAGAAGARASVMELPLCFLRLRSTRLKPRLDRDRVEAELPPSDLDERYLTAMNEFVNSKRSHVQEISDLVSGPHGTFSSQGQDGSPRYVAASRFMMRGLRVPRGVLGIRLSHKSPSEPLRQPQRHEALRRVDFWLEAECLDGRVRVQRY